MPRQFPQDLNNKLNADGNEPTTSGLPSWAFPNEFSNNVYAWAKGGDCAYLYMYRILTYTYIYIYIVFINIHK